MAIDLDNETNDFMATDIPYKLFRLLCPNCPVSVTSSLSTAAHETYIYERALLAAFVNWLLDNDRVGILRRDR